MDQEFAALLERLPQFKDGARDLREILLTNLVMISEIPAPTFGEKRRVEFLLERFNEYQLQNCSTDEADNALGILPGTRSDRTILVVAHMDTAFPDTVDHTVSVEPVAVSGAGIGDNSLGLAALVSLPMLLSRLEIQLRSDVILMGSSRSLGRGDIEGIRFFMNHRKIPVSTGICVEGVKLGRLSHHSIGMLRGEIEYRVPEEYDWTRFGAGGAILNMTDMINRILEIPLPRRPRSSIVLNRVEAGASFNAIPRRATLQFEVRSESEDLVSRVGEQITDIVAETSSQTGADVDFRVLARRRPGGIPFAHPLAATARGILRSLGINPRISPSTSELSAFIDNRIPAVTIGLTEGEAHDEVTERLEIEPLFLGLAQLVALLVAIDGGIADEPQ